MSIAIPLAERMRPKKLSDMIGQQKLIGPEGVISRIIQYKSVPSLLLWGPPGVGKTTLALLIAQEVDRPLHMLSAISAGVKEVREVLDKAKYQARPLLFIDEIHRFNKSQQDALLAAVEKGTITLIGATTENPSFEVNAALLSRCQIYKLEALDATEILHLIENAIANDEILKTKSINITSLSTLYALSAGDARKALNLLELLVNSSGDFVDITDDSVMAAAQQKVARYDKAGEQHYDIISAFIKSIRGSDPNAAVYYLAQMAEAGEEVTFIARRMLILAAEDIGNANPTALVIATNTFQAVQAIGWPESVIILSQCATYLASSPKSNASYLAIKKAQKAVRELPDLEVPLSLRNAPTSLMKQMGYGKEYQYSHNHPGNFAHQEFLPKELSGTTFYEPQDNERERAIRAFLKQRWKDKYGY